MTAPADRSTEAKAPPALALLIIALLSTMGWVAALFVGMHVVAWIGG